MNQSLGEQLEALLDVAEAAYAGTAEAADLGSIRARSAEPLRVAIAGKLKAGKSTLLNALVGTELALTDATECTRIVTWYRDGLTYDVRVHPRTGKPRQTSFDRTDNGVVIDLGGASADDIDHIDVTWPSPSLRTMTLIDTPGVGSVNADIAARTWQFLAPEEGDVTQADSVIYLMRHLHAEDIDLLSAFQDDAIARATPINAVAVLSRADEVGAGRLDAMESAARVADRLATEPAVHRLVQTVLPVAGLLGEAGATLTEAEFRQLRSLAWQDPTDLSRQLLSADRFTRDVAGSDVTPEDRHALLMRLGVFGVRLSAHLISEGQVTTATELAAELRQRSGLEDLRSLLGSVFLERADILKARSTIAALEALLHRAPPAHDDSDLEVALERLVSSTHDFAELHAVESLRAGTVHGKPEVLEEAERLLGSTGRSPASRLALSEDATAEAVDPAARAAQKRWQKRAESPMTNHELGAICRVVVRSCEEMIINSGGAQ